MTIHKFSNLINKFPAFPQLALFIIKALIPILSVIFVLSAITLSTERLCPEEVLNIIFDVNENDEKTQRYLAAKEFIESGKEFVYYIVNQIANLFKYMLSDLIPNHQFSDLQLPNNCPKTKDL
jgi:hypothetical protein